MNRLSSSSAVGSVLPKITFTLVLFIAAAAGYLVVKERMRARQQQEALAAQAAEFAKAAARMPFGTGGAEPAASPAEKPAYAPLRPRVETNVARVPTNRAVNLPGGGQQAIISKATAEQALARVAPETVAANSAPLTPGGMSARGGGRSITGRVLLRGTPPPEKLVTMDAACAAIQPKPITTRHYQVGKDGGLADVFVYVKQGAAPTAAPESQPPPLLDQTGCEYLPYVIGVQTGHTLVVRNSDPVLHNVHTLPKVPGNRERNIAQSVKGLTAQFTFDKPEVFIQIKCDVHPWMFAYVGVAEHPWFAVTDGQGNFALPGGLPSGDYTLAAVHRKAGELVQVVSASAGVVTFTFDVPAP